MNYERCKGFIYEIQEGDTLYLLSRRFSIPLVELMRANPYADVYQLRVGDTLCIPDFPRPPIGRPPCNNCRPPMGRPPMGRPPMGDMKPPTGDENPPTGDEKPPTGDMRPPTGDMNPPTGDMRPPTEDMRPPMGGMKPPCNDCKPPTGDMKPPCNGCKPPMGSCKPMKPWSPENMDGLRPWGMEYDGDEGYGMGADAYDGNNVIKYVVQDNDTLGNLLSDFEMDLDDFFELNDIKQMYFKPGMVILLRDKK